jgi:hypothetical protein
MNSTLNLYEIDKGGMKGYTIFLYFLISVALSQFFADYSTFLSLTLLLISFVLLALFAVSASKAQLFYFMFFTIVMNLLIPFTTDRTFSQVIPFLFFIVVLLKSQVISDKVTANGVTIALTFYFIFVFVAFFHGLELPFGLSGKKTGNTGFLARWNLLNTFFVFAVAVVSFKTETLPDLLHKFYRLLLVILIISLIIFYLDITSKLPVFNTFSWTVIYEGAGSKRMGVAGMAANYLFIYFLCFKTHSKNYWVILILIVLGVFASGGRAAMLTFLLVAYLNWVIKHRILVKSFVISCLVVLAFIAFSLSPLILHIPEKIQRLFIIFPKEFYSGSLEHLANTAAANSSTCRYNMWTKAAEDLKGNMLFGKGFGVPKATYSFSEEGMSAFQSKTPEIVYHDFMAGGQLHNTYISLAYIMGIPAAVFFMYAFFALIYKTYQYYLSFDQSDYGPYVKFLLLALFSDFVSSLFGDIYFGLMFFIFLAITLKIIRHLNGVVAVDTVANKPRDK